MPNDYTFSGIRLFTPIQSFELGLNGAGIGNGREMVNLHNGNHLFEFNDLTIPFFNSPLTLKRYYNNLCDAVGMFGKGWHSIWEMKLIEDGDDIRFIDQTAAKWIFTDDQQGGFNRPDGLFASLLKNGNEYKITYFRDKTEVFFYKDDITGDIFLQRIVNSTGVVHEIESFDKNYIRIRAYHTFGEAHSREIAFECDWNGLVRSMVNPSGMGWIFFEYIESRLLSKVIYPNGNFCEFYYDENENLVGFKDYNGNLTSYEYDIDGLLTKRINALGLIHLFTYNQNQTTVIDPRGKSWTHNFDGNDCRTSLVTPRGKTYSWTYNDDRLVLTYVIPGPITSVVNTYDSNGFIQTTTDALGKQYEFNWDSNDLLTAIIDPDSNSIFFSYNANRQVTKVTNQKGHETEYKYDSLGSLEEVKDPNGFSTRLFNNGYGMPVKTIDPLGLSVETEFDPFSIVPVAIKNKAGNTTTYRYDQLLRILSKTFPSGETLNYRWEGALLKEITKNSRGDFPRQEQTEPIKSGGFESVVNKEPEGDKPFVGSVIDYVRYTHDSTNRVIAVEAMNEDTTLYKFDPTGQLRAVAGRDCLIREYVYDDDGNLVKVRNLGDDTAEYDFEVDDRGWRTKIGYPNGWFVDYLRNDRGQITRIALNNDQQVEKHRIDYDYDNLALLSSIIENDYDNQASFETDFERDEIGRVTRENRQTQSGTWGDDYDLNLDYNRNGSINGIENAVTGGKNLRMVFDPINKLVLYHEATEDKVGLFSYDCLGMLRGKLEENNELTLFGYDETGVLDKITLPDGEALEFDFDLLGRLRGYNTDDRNSRFNYDGTKRLGDFDADDAQWKRYHWCRSQFLGYKDNENTYYIVPDMNDSTKIIIDADTGEIVNRLDYDHLGKIRNQTTEPQVELLWRTYMFNDKTNIYIDNHIYQQEYGKSMFLSLYMPHIINPTERIIPVITIVSLESCSLHVHTMIVLDDIYNIHSGVPIYSMDYSSRSCRKAIENHFQCYLQVNADYDPGNRAAGYRTCDERWMGQINEFCKKNAIKDTGRGGAHSW